MSENIRKAKVRREMLRGAFDDNIEALTGQPAGTLSTQRRQRRQRWRKILLTVSLVSLAGFSVGAWLALPNHELSNSDAAGNSRPLVLSALDEDDADEMENSPLERLAERLSMQKPQSLMQDILPLEIETVVIDPGHGGRDGGTSLKFGLNEKDLTRDIADRLVTELERTTINTILTRTGDETVSLKERVAIANEADADLFVSIHVNWLPNRQARGVETYYLGTTDDPFLQRLAAAENKDSGYTMGDYRDLLEGIYADVRHSESRRLARTVQNALFQTLKQQNERIVSRGVLTAPFVVLVATDMPAILAEVACLSNDNEARLLAIPSYRQRIAEALFTGIIQYSQSAQGRIASDPIPE